MFLRNILLGGLLTQHISFALAAPILRSTNSELFVGGIARPIRAPALSSSYNHQAQFPIAPIAPGNEEDRPTVKSPINRSGTYIRLPTINIEVKLPNGAAINVKLPDIFVLVRGLTSI